MSVRALSTSGTPTFLACLADGANPLQLQGQVCERVRGISSRIFEVHSDRACVNHIERSLARALGTSAVPSFNICRNGHYDRPRDPGNGLDHPLGSDLFAVRKSLGESNACAGRGNGPKAGFLDDASAGDVPHVDQQQRLLRRMQSSQSFSFAALILIGKRACSR